MEIRKLQKKLLREELRRRRKSSSRYRLLVTGAIVGLILIFTGAAYYLYNFDKLLERDFQVAEDLVEQGDYQAATEAFRTIQSRHPSFHLAPQALFQAAEVLNLYQKSYSEALLAYLLVEKDYPDSEQARRAQRQVAEIYKNRLRDYGEAIVAYQKLLDGGVADGDRVHYEIADAYFRLNNFEQARIEFESLLKSWPESPLVPEVRYRIATVYALDGDLRGAEGAYRAIIRDWPNDPFALEARLGLAGVLEQQEQLKAALAILEDLRGIYPNPEVLERRLEQIRQRIRKKQDAL